ncbi:hypothetical protein ACTA71_004232 [Dictyostelium dimigraforme]
MYNHYSIIKHLLAELRKNIKMPENVENYKNKLIERMDSDKQLIESNEENINVQQESNNESQDSSSHGSNNSMDTVVNNRDEEYIKRLLDDKEVVSIVRRVQLLEIRNVQLDKESRVKELKRMEIQDKAVLLEIELKKRVIRLEATSGCITHLNEIKSQSDTVKDMRSEIGQLKAELERVIVENDQLKADKQVKKENTFLDEEHGMGGEDKIKSVSKNEIKDNGSEYGAIHGKSKTGNHGPVKFFEELENVFQMHEVVTLDNRIRVIKMKILDHCNYVDRINSSMSWKQVMELVASNDDCASRHLYYKELVSNATRKVL